MREELGSVGRVPRYWNEERMILIHKGRHRSKKDINNYRPIAVVGKLWKIYISSGEGEAERAERCKVMGEEREETVENRGE